jgi:NADH-quinone oxidoreductase subunit F
MKMDFADPLNYGLLGLGTAAAVVVNEDTDIRLVLDSITKFFAHESCGQCTQCREGTSWAYKMSRRISAGRGRTTDLDVMRETAGNLGMMPGLSICGLSDGAAFPIRTIIDKFRGELEGYVSAEATLPGDKPLAVVN